MRFKEIDNKRGKFWFPSQSEAASGTLTISNDGIIRLDIDELQLEPADAFGNDPVRYDHVIGRIEGGRFAIFENCTRIYSRNLLGGSITGILNKRGFRATRAFIGFPERFENMPCFNEINFSIEGIDQWVNIRGISMALGDETIDTPDYTVTYERPETISFAIGGGMKMNIIFGWGIHPARTSSEVRLVEEVLFQLISSTPLKIKSFISVAEKVRKLLCFVMNKHVSIDSMSASLDLDREDSARPIGIDIYGPQIYARKIPVDNNRMLFTFSNGQSDPNDSSVRRGSIVIKKWVGHYEKYEDAFDLYITAQTIQQPKLKFLLLAQGIEVFHRIKKGKKAKNYDLIYRILDLLKDPVVTYDGGFRLVDTNTISNLANALKASDYMTNYMKYYLKCAVENYTKCSKSDGENGHIVINMDTSQLEHDMAVYYMACYIRDTRNYLTHYDRKKKPKAASGDDLHSLSLKLEMLLDLHFLDLLGFRDDEEIGRVLTNLSHKRNAPLSITP